MRKKGKVVEREAAGSHRGEMVKSRRFMWRGKNNMRPRKRVSGTGNGLWLFCSFIWIWERWEFYLSLMIYAVYLQPFTSCDLSNHLITQPSLRILFAFSKGLKCHTVAYSLPLLSWWGLAVSLLPCWFHRDWTFLYPYATFIMLFLSHPLCPCSL